MFKPTLHFFDFAHCRPMAEMAEVIATHENVFTDCSYMPPEHMSRLRDFDWRGRLMFGSDFPACHARQDLGFAKWYREALANWESTGYDSQSAVKRILTVGKTNKKGEKQNGSNGRQAK